jgi:dGTP triphosphohydrolase
MTYSSHIAEVEKQLDLRPQAAKALDCQLITGESAADAYGHIFSTPDGEAKLRGRTPLSLDRDRILYSDAFRRQDDKYHVLFFRKTRRARNYTSHAVKAAHVARSVAGRLHLNTDLAEAIVLGSKTGGVPFLHVGKIATSAWIEKKVRAIDSVDAGARRIPAHRQKQKSKSYSPPQLDMPEERLQGTERPPVEPRWISEVKSRVIYDKVRNYFPFAFGSDTDPAYSSGQQSYWGFVCNPFLLKARSERGETTFTAQTLYGIWRHSIPDEDSPTHGFKHQITLEGDDTELALDDSHATYEAMIARYCDDITWALENLAEASRVDSLDGAGTTAYQRLAADKSDDLPSTVTSALLKRNLGKLYTFFIDDLITASERNLKDAPKQASEEAIQSAIALTPAGTATLEIIIDFLNDHVFVESAITSRNKAVEAITTTALDLMYDSDEDLILRRIEQLGRVENWSETDMASSEFKKRLSDNVFRIQTSVALLVSMSDRDLFDMIGLD